MENLYQIYLNNPHISIDTRTIVAGSIFVALKGENFDGNQFALKALSLGASHVITENKELKDHPGCIVVEDSLKTLQELALYHRQHLKMPIIGITGTNGKTTTKELIVAVLSKKYKVASTKGNYNNHIGVPLTLLSISNTDDIAVVEMGANHPGEIAELCALALPNYGIITNVGNAHFEGFGSFEKIVETKAALYKSVIAAGGTIFANGDDEILFEALDHYQNVVYYSQQSPATVNGHVVKMEPFLIVNLFGKDYETHITGDYNLYNILCATTVGRHFGVPKEAIVEAITNYRPDNCRSQIIEKEGLIIIADFYNANPTSMEAALHNLYKTNYPEKVAILGDMFELGTESEDAHRSIIELCKEYSIESFFVGEEFYKVSENKENAFRTLEDLDNFLQQHPLTGKIILIKGSRGIHLEKLRILQD